MKNLIDQMLNPPSRRYRLELKVSQWLTDWTVTYSAVGERGAIHYHVSRFIYEGAARYSSGLECHYRQPPDYKRDTPPDHDLCPLLKTPCWHDGTSLYARERYEPMFLMNDHEGIFRQLELDAEERFNSKPSEEAA